jgi:hypothetical protein
MVAPSPYLCPPHNRCARCPLAFLPDCASAPTVHALVCQLRRGAVETLSLHAGNVSSFLPHPEACYEITLPNGCVLTKETAAFLLTGILSHMPLTSETFSVDDADLAMYDDEALAPAPPSFIVAKTNNLRDEWGTPHGKAIVLYSANDGGATYLIKEYLKVQHGMERGKWWWEGECLQTWMSWEDAAAGWNVEPMAEALSTYLIENFGWEVDVQDWSDAPGALVGAEAGGE